MSQLKPSFIKRIYDSVKSSCFSLSDFDFDFPSSGRVLAKIIFKHYPEYRLILTEKIETNTVKVKHGPSSFYSSTRETENKFTVFYLLEAPGDYKLNDEHEIRTIDELLTRLPSWCKNIHSDISTRFDIEDPFTSFRKQLESLINENIEDPDSPFNESEIDTLAGC